MLPKLTPLQWAIAIAFLAFYGFAVFALTRDYYLLHPPRPAAAPAASAAGPGLGQQMRAALDDAGDLPAGLTESDPVLLAQEADRLFAAERFAEAVTLYRRVLEMRPDDTDARNDLGLALFYAGNSAEGLKELRAGAEAAPGYQRIWLSLGFVAAQAGDTDLAREALTKAKVLDPDSDIGAEAARLLGLL